MRKRYVYALEVIITVVFITHVAVTVSGTERPGWPEMYGLFSTVSSVTVALALLYSNWPRKSRAQVLGYRAALMLLALQNWRTLPKQIQTVASKLSDPTQWVFYSCVIFACIYAALTLTSSGVSYTAGKSRLRSFIPRA